MRTGGVHFISSIRLSQVMLRLLYSLFIASDIKISIDYNFGLSENNALITCCPGYT